MNKFELLDISDVTDFYDSNTEIQDEVDYKLCPKCNVYMSVKLTNEFICEECGLSKIHMTSNAEYNNTATDSNYNTLNYSSVPLKCIGGNSFKYQYLLRSNSSYSVIQENTIKNTLFRLNYNSTDVNIPKDILLKVNEQYKIIRNANYIYRGQILKGILASLTYYECLKQKITHKPKEIAAWFEIDSNNLSKGDKIIRTLAEDKVIDLDLDEIAINMNFIYSYVMRLEIDMIYLDFLYELLERVEQMKIINPNSRSSTKAASLVYLLIVCKNLPITQEMIYDELKISTSTFKTTTAKILKKSQDKDLIKDIFDKYNIPTMTSIPRASKKKRNIK